MQLWLVLALIIVACSSESRRDSIEQRYWQADRGERSEDPELRRGAAREMASICCDRSAAAAGYRSRACTSVSLGLRYGDDRTRLMVKAVAIETGVLACFERVSPEDCASVGCPPDLRESLVYQLEQDEPSCGVMHEIMEHMRSSVDPAQPGRIADTSERDQFMRTPQEQLRDATRSAIATFGEEELECAIHEVWHPDPLIRRAVIEGIEGAMRLAPLDSAPILAALDKAAKGLNQEVASLAERVAAAYRKQGFGQVDAERAVERLRTSHSLHESIRLLSVRRFSCRANTAEDALGELAANKDLSVASAAKQALVLRRRRCALSSEVGKRE